MKVRIKFSKEGPVKFVGHLDTMRYFQKAIRRANLPVAFSGGYSPHMIMSFAAPLGVGTESLGEYFDLELAETVPTSEITRRLDAVMVEGVHVLSTRQVEDGKAGKAMSLVAAADYYVEFRPGKEPEISWKDKISDFLAQPEITVMKTSGRQDLYDACFRKCQLHKTGTGNRYILFMAWHRTSGICLFHQTSGSIRR